MGESGRGDGAEGDLRAREPEPSRPVGPPDPEEARRALLESEARHRRLLEVLPDAVITYRDGRIDFANAVALRMVGAARPEELVGTPALERVHPDSRQRALERMARVARGEEVPLAEERLVRLDGTSFPAEVSAAPLGPGAALVVVRDVTARRRDEAERSALRDRLREAEKLEALGTLAGGLAHDFNNVLATILGHADALAAELAPGSVAREDASQIAAAARRAKGLVQQILAFARRGPAEPRPVDVATAVREDLALVRAAMPATVVLVPRIDAAAGLVQADPAHLRQVLLALCANARDAVQACGGHLEVVVARAEAPGADAPPGLPAGPYVRLTVRDDGPGMDAATRARAFDPFFTTKPPGGGSGLGLSVVHGIASTLGGAVALDAAPGRGAAVTVWLPRLAELAAVPQPRPATPAAQGRVLLVDDDPTVALALRRMLESLGYDVTVSPDGTDALARFQGDPAAFDLVLTDETLPGLRGHQLARALLALRPGIPVLLCTGYSDQIDEERARTLGARALLLKPLDRAQLAAALRTALQA